MENEEQKNTEQEPESTEEPISPMPVSSDTFAETEVKSEDPSTDAPKKEKKKSIIKKRTEVKPKKTEKKEAKQPKAETPSSFSSLPEPVSSFSFPNLQKIALYLFILLGILLFYNVYTLWQTSGLIEEKLAEAERAAIPLDITVMLITPVDCEDCFPTNTVLAEVEALNVNITEQKEFESNSDEAKQLIEGYQIKTLPAIILGFDPAMALEVKPEVVNQLEALEFENVDDETDYVPPSTGYKWEAVTPPYYDVETNAVKGLVTIISITAPDCDDCQDISGMIPALEDALTVEEVQEYAYGSAEANEYIGKYDLKFVPTFIISADAKEYKSFAEAWVSYGTEEDDGSFIFRNSIPPYMDTATGEILGLVDIIYLTDESCVDCYNVTIHENILKGFGIVFDEETTIDISSEQGKELLEKYEITKVPTVILSKDAGEYSALAKIWLQVGSIAEDGSYIFTNMEQMKGAVYTDLEKDNETAE